MKSELVDLVGNKPIRTKAVAKRITTTTYLGQQVASCQAVDRREPPCHGSCYTMALLSINQATGPSTKPNTRCSIHAHRWPNRTRERGMDSWCLAFIGCVTSRAARGDDSNSDGNNFNGDERLLQQQQYNGGLCAVSHFHYTDINKQVVLTAVYLIIIQMLLVQNNKWDTCYKKDYSDLSTSSKWYCQ